MASLQEQLGLRLATAFATVAGEEVDPVLRRSQFADFQADGSLPLAHRRGEPPRAIAERVVEALELDDLCSLVEVSGPGFINLTVSDAALGSHLTEMAVSDRLGVSTAAERQRVIVDYSAPNVAKEMHVGHLRSTYIGDAAVRLLEWLGHEVIRENHIGDWGAPFGMLIEHMLDLGETEAVAEISIGDLDDFYKAARAKFDGDERFAERSRQRVVQLQGGDEPTLALWRTLLEASERYFLSVYDRLGVRLGPDDFVGESTYNDQLDSVVDELEAAGLLRESDGALCVFPEGFTNRDGDPLPLIVRNRVGGYGYATTDLATIRQRFRKQGADCILYVVGLPQRQHLEMIFQTAREAGWVPQGATAEHIGFGSVLGDDGKMLRSRAGRSVKLIDLLDEAVQRAHRAAVEKNPELDETEATAVAEAVGIGATKFADLSTERTKDYVFDYDRMLAFDGQTAPYLQYAHARVHSIFRRGGIDDTAVGPIAITEPAEHRLGLQLAEFPDVVAEVAESLEFHRLAYYLFDLATAFTAFYESCPVLKAESAVRLSRLGLCRLTARVLAQGLELLGIEALDRM